MKPVERIANEAYELPVRERRVLMEGIRQSLIEFDPEVERAQLEIVKKRIREIEEGKAQWIPWQEVMIPMSLELYEEERKWPKALSALAESACGVADGGGLEDVIYKLYLFIVFMQAKEKGAKAQYLEQDEFKKEFARAFSLDEFKEED